MPEELTIRIRAEESEQVQRALASIRQAVAEIGGSVKVMSQRFNPTMVRLLHPSVSVKPDRGEGFNPTMVRLLLRQKSSKGGIEQGFNPTMVRLLHVFAQRIAEAAAKFQSHNGAIAA